MPNFYHDGRHTPDNRDDFASADPGVIANADGRLMLNVYGDGDDDDAEVDRLMLHSRRNTRALPADVDVPDPFFKRRSL